MVLYTPKKMDDNNVLLIENGGRKAYVVDKTGTKLQSFVSPLIWGMILNYCPMAAIWVFLSPKAVCV